MQSLSCSIFLEDCDNRLVKDFFVNDVDIANNAINKNIFFINIFLKLECVYCYDCGSFL